MSKTLRSALIAFGVAVLYVGCAKLGLALAFRAAQVTAVWPATGFAIAAAFWFRGRAIPGILLGAFIANATADEPLWVAAGIAIGNTLEAIAGAWILRRFDFDSHLARVRDVVTLLGAVIAAPVVSASIGVASLGLGGVQPMSSLPELWSIWWIGDALGGLLVAPALFVWSHRQRVAIVEGLLLIAGLFASCYLVFVRLPAVGAAEYVIFPFLVWAALRFGSIGTATAAIVANAIAVFGTQAGTGPFAGSGPEQGLVLLQIFMAAAAMTGLFLGAVAAQNRRTEQQLRLDIDIAKTLEDELREETRRRDEFLAMLGHELRNPLAPILHAAELLDVKADDRRHVDVIRRQSRHLARLVDDLLDVSRVTSGKVRLEKKRVTLAEIVSSAVDMWKHAIARHRQELTIDLGSEPLWLDVDPTRCTQVVANLLHNASKFTPEEGRISVTALRVEGFVVLRVRDTGAGMSVEMRARAFDLFVQGPRAIDRPLGGLGIGLTLVRRLVEMHGGSVQAASDGRGKGTEIIVRLPAAEAPAAPGPRIEIACPRASSRAKRILVVEDHDDARDVLMLMLQRDGHHVRGAADGASALVLADELAPEIVLLDIGLPRMDGYAVAEKLRANPRCAAATLIALTGYGQQEDRDRSKAAGFDHHLLKPLEPAQLMELISSSC